jgi:hypothetical protein
MAAPASKFTNVTVTGNLSVLGSMIDSAGAQRLVNATAKAIADGAATGLFTVACAPGDMSGGLVMWTVQNTDDTDFVAMSGITTYTAVNKAGTITADITYATANESKAASGGATLTLSFTITDDGDFATFKVQPTGSLTETLHTITFTVVPLVGAVTLL